MTAFPPAPAPRIVVPESVPTPALPKTGTVTGVTARCAADCGHCCDPVKLNYHPHRLKAWQSANVAALVAANDPATDEGWAAWVANGWTDENRDQVLADVQPGSTRQLNADFMNTRWTLLTGSEDPAAAGFREVRCDAYNPQTRRCGAYEDRPPICSDYPHYGEPLEPGAWLPPVCSYNAEVRTMLPIVAIR